MTYHGRVVVLGMNDGKIFAGNVLQSRSDQDRIIKPWKDSANVVPSEAKLDEVVAQLREGDLSITHNSYPCSYGFRDTKGNTYIVGCNGRFAGAVKRKVRRGDELEESIDTAFDASDPKSGDPRLIAVGSQIDGKNCFYLGAFDLDDLPYWSKKVEIKGNQAKYIDFYSKREVRELDLNGVAQDKLAKFLFESILGENPEFGIGASVCIQNPEGFDINVFNQKK